MTNTLYGQDRRFAILDEVHQRTRVTPWQSQGLLKPQTAGILGRIHQQVQKPVSYMRLVASAYFPSISSYFHKLRNNCHTASRLALQIAPTGCSPSKSTPPSRGCVFALKTRDLPHQRHRIKSSVYGWSITNGRMVQGDPSSQHVRTHLSRNMVFVVGRGALITMNRRGESLRLYQQWAMSLGLSTSVAA